MIAAFALGLHWGVVGVAGFYAAARTVVLVVSLVVTSRALGVEIPRVVWRLGRVLAHCLAMALAVYAARRGLLQVSLEPFVRLALLVPVGVTVYLAIIWWRDRALLFEIKGLIARR